MEGVILALIYIGVLVVTFSFVAVAMRNLIGLAVAFLVATIIAFIVAVGVAACTLDYNNYFSTWNNVLWFISVFLIILAVIFLLVVIWIRSTRKAKMTKVADKNRQGIHQAIADHPSSSAYVYEEEEKEVYIEKPCDTGSCSQDPTPDQDASKKKTKRLMSWMSK
jgi:lysylphosphatidylglycerol synthetase-like protein (DUF2156 family)